ncbi:MAG: adenylate kinase [Acidobacteriota bacterium]
MRLVLLGPPNSGKGTQAAQLAEHLGIPAISTGDMLREAVAEGSELGRRVDSIMQSGRLVDDETMAAVVRERLAKVDAAKGFLLDGYPRTLPQVETLEGLLADADRELDAAVQIVVPKEILIERALARGRKDDSAEVMEERLKVYGELTAPLVGYYGGRSLLRTVDGDRSIDQVFASILEAIGR